MDFRTEVTIPDFPWKTGYQKKNLFLGSCFTENIGQKMARLYYNVEINPFGILYNPLSVANGIDLLISKKQFEKEDLIRHENLWHSFSHHGKFSSTAPEDTLDKINSRLKHAAQYLRETDFLFITFGTAWVYQYKTTGKIVSNCHKIPATEFARKRLTLEEIVEVYIRLIAQLRETNPGLKIVFTISPIRHWKDGAIENQRSKSTLLLAVDKITRHFSENQCCYFPSYEIIMDELRDYRFYNTDMLHLTDLAINFIWEKFENKLIDAESRKIAGQVQKIALALNHKPFNKFTLEHHSFLSQTLKKAEQLAETYRFLNLAEIEDSIKKQMTEIELNTKGFSIK